MIKAIETEYKGYRFRSRLEARWAVFFDEAGVKWEYETEGFELPSGKRYLPDFKIHNVHDTRSNTTYDSLWVEVKGCMTQDDMERITEFVNFDDGKTFTAENPTLIVGNIPDGTSIADIMHDMYSRFDKEETNHEFNFATVDGDWFALALMVGDGGKLVMCGCDNNYDWGYNPELTLNAYTYARQARFEHGENPQGDNHITASRLAELKAQRERNAERNKIIKLTNEQKRKYRTLNTYRFIREAGYRDIGCGGSENLCNIMNLTEAIEGLGLKREDIHFSLIQGYFSLKRWELVLDLHSQGMSAGEISRRIGWKDSKVRNVIYSGKTKQELYARERGSAIGKLMEEAKSYLEEK